MSPGPLPRGAGLRFGAGAPVRGQLPGRISHYNRAWGDVTDYNRADADERLAADRNVLTDGCGAAEIATVAEADEAADRGARRHDRRVVQNAVVADDATRADPDLFGDAGLPADAGTEADAAAVTQCRTWGNAGSGMDQGGELLRCEASSRQYLSPLGVIALTADRIDEAGFRQRTSGGAQACRILQPSQHRQSERPGAPVRRVVEHADDVPARPLRIERLHQVEHVERVATSPEDDQMGGRTVRAGNYARGPR